jgi:hypothetical protein
MEVFRHAARRTTVKIASTFKKSLLLGAIALSFYSVSVAAQTVDANAPQERMTYRDNYVYLKMKTSDYTLISGTYRMRTRSITSGQDPHGYNDPPRDYDISGSNGSMKFSVGRSGSTQVANWFNQYLAPGQNTFSHLASDLNFAFGGTLELVVDGPGFDRDNPVIFSGIFFAQGHSAGHNNWWFGGTKCTQSGDHSVTCTSDNYPGKFVFTRGGNGNPVDQVDMYFYPTR